MSLSAFNAAWGDSPDLAPLFVVVGGAAGTGKSTVAGELSAQIPGLTVVSTALIRTVLRATRSNGLWLDAHTYDLPSVEAFVEQSRPIMAAINELARFARSERQLFAVEGSSLVPGLFSEPVGVTAIELYLAVSDPDQHRMMLGGPTHARKLSERQFGRCRVLQDFIIAEAAQQSRIVVEFDAGLDVALALVEDRLRTT
ncbi:MAG: hypothetical protein EXR58_00980 [Chloroflexi bacterium]|nr:hypothetical protein [Chloroflexota bacterium]